MSRTPASLLERLQQSPGADDWERLVELYTPLLYRWARQAGSREDEAADLVQDVFEVLVRTFPEFRYDPSRSFRAWLKTVLLNRWRATARGRFAARTVSPGDDLDQFADRAMPVEFEEQEHRDWVVARALELIRRDFEPATWHAAWALVVEGRSVPDVTRALGITTAAAYAAKSRVLRKLRAEFRGLID